jgi:hypothetical protein
MDFVYRVYEEQIPDDECRDEMPASECGMTYWGGGAGKRLGGAG